MTPSRPSRINWDDDDYALGTEIREAWKYGPAEDPQPAPVAPTIAVQPPQRPVSTVCAACGGEGAKPTSGLCSPCYWKTDCPDCYKPVTRCNCFGML